MHQTLEIFHKNAYSQFSNCFLAPIKVLNLIKFVKKYVKLYINCDNNANNHLKTFFGMFFHLKI